MPWFSTRYKLKDPSWEWGSGVYCSQIRARSRDEAIKKAKRRGMGETIEDARPTRKPSNAATECRPSLLLKAWAEPLKILHAATFLCFVAQGVKGIKLAGRRPGSPLADIGILHETVHFLHFRTLHPWSTDKYRMALIRRWIALERAVPGYI